MTSLNGNTVLMSQYCAYSFFQANWARRSLGGRKKTVGLILMLALLAFSGVVKPSAAQVRVEQAWPHGPPGYVDSLTISTAGLEVVVYKDGEVRGQSGGNRFVFRLPTREQTIYLNPFYWSETDTTFVLVYGESTGTEGRSYLSIIRKPSLELVDRTHIRGVSLQPPVFRGTDVYLRATGTVAKYDLSSQSYEWRHTDLYNRQRYTFNVIDEPSWTDGSVMFTSEGLADTPEGIRVAHSDTLVIDDASGRILRRK